MPLPLALLLVLVRIVCPPGLPLSGQPLPHAFHERLDRFGLHDAEEKSMYMRRTHFGPGQVVEDEERSQR